MGYPLALDEMSIIMLQKEVTRRNMAFRNGDCTYCGRPHSVVPSCRFENRHSGKEK